MSSQAEEIAALRFEIDNLTTLVKGLASVIDNFAGLPSSVTGMDHRLADVQTAVGTLTDEQKNIRELIADTVTELKPTIESLMNGPLGMLVGR